VLRCPWEVEDAKVKRELERERNTQAPGIWLDIDLYIAESAGSSQRGNCASILEAVYGSSIFCCTNERKETTEIFGFATSSTVATF
jgi:hypothetical protein